MSAIIGALVGRKHDDRAHYYGETLRGGDLLANSRFLHRMGDPI
jgi:hypothetical protein